MKRRLTLALTLLLTTPALAASGPQGQQRPALRSRVSTTSAPMPKLLPKMVPWPEGATMPEERKGTWRTTNITRDYFSRPVADPAGPNGHDRVLDALLDARRQSKSVLMIGGINLHKEATHSSTDNFDKSKLVRGQMN